MTPQPSPVVAAPASLTEPVVLPPVPSSPPTAPAREPVSAAAAPLLFEISWEVCWQLGGIYTVLRSKAASMIQRWDDRLFEVGVVFE